MINDLRVLPKFPESDHKAIAFEINCQSLTRNLEVEDENNWKSMYKYIFTSGSQERINNALHDDIPESYRDKLLSTISELCKTEEVAKAFDIYLKQAFYGNVSTLHGRIN